MTPEFETQTHASPFARTCLVAYLVLIVYASWFPFSGWQINNLSALTDVLQQWPRYWGGFDAGVNIVGYIPLGILLVFSLYPKLRGVGVVCTTALLGGLISLGMECVQYFLPSRVTSLLDVLTNFSGATIGALLGVRLSPTVLEKGRLRLLQKQWLRNESSRQLVVLGLWPLAQIYPQAYLFGLGQLLPILSAWTEDILEIDIDLGELLRQGIDLSAEEFLLSETLITACGCTGAILLCLSLFNRHAPKFALSITLLAMAFSVKSLASALMFQPEHAFIWLTPGAQGGLLISAIMLYGFSYAPHQAQRRLAVLLLLLSLCIVNLIPTNPYFAATLQSWSQGKFLNFYGAAQFLTVMWPFIALRYLIFSRPTQPN